MRTVAKAFVWAGAALIATAANAIVPANPRVIAGIDHITPTQLGNALSKFCNANGCVSKLVWHKHGDYLWNITLHSDTTPVSVANGCVGIPHQYCVQTWGTLGKEFMSSVQTQQLKHLLEAEAATVVLMDCQLRLGGHNVCANGKAPP